MTIIALTSISSIFNLRKLMENSKLAFILIITILCCDKYKIFWKLKCSMKGLQSTYNSCRETIIPRKEHLFIYKTFRYDQSTLLNHTGLFDQSLFVVLFMASRWQHVTERMLCLISQQHQQMGAKKVAVRLERMDSLGVCELELYVLHCEMKWKPWQREHYNFEPIEFSLLFRDLTENGQLKSTKLKLQPEQPIYKKMEFVMCISRVIAFERWQLLIIVMEFYRHFKVDLIVTHVHSALLSVFSLMKIYEEEGILAIRPAMKFPHLFDMSWDPNSQTEFNGQILLSHDCFYTYRNNAPFIALIDWDDLLVPNGPFNSLPKAFAVATQRHPDAAYFLVNKLESSFIEQVLPPSQFELKRTLAGILTAPLYNDEKMVVRPSHLRGFWMHNSNFLEPHKRPVGLLTNYSIILHLANDERADSTQFENHLLNKFDFKTMDENAARILRKLSNDKMIDDLPNDQPYYDALVNCHKYIFAYYKYLSGTGKPPQCVSYSLCDLPSVNKSCVSVESHYSSKRTLGGAHFIHILNKSKFITRFDGCINKGSTGI